MLNKNTIKVLEKSSDFYTKADFKYISKDHL